MFGDYRNNVQKKSILKQIKNKKSLPGKIKVGTPIIGVERIGASETDDDEVRIRACVFYNNHFR